jgi:precorrin-6B C5,15-methyltransferase / cobalt-precorrin-6B C5,C15-methyltransferase
MNKVKVIGIGDDGAEGLFPLYRQWINDTEVLAGGERQLAFFPDHPGEKIPFQGGLKEALERIADAAATRSVAVLASGDPLFYGVAGLIVRRLGAEHVEVHPHLSSLQLAFARMGESWQDAHVESVHGRSIQGLAQRIDGKEKVALLTDGTHTPAAIAAYLLRFKMTEYRAFIAENLGGRDERCGWYELEELAEAECSPLNVMILKRKTGAAVPRWSLGMEDAEFFQRKPDKGLITKREVRVLSLSELRLQPDSVVWDIGAGSGSVAVEAAKIAYRGKVFAVEKNEEDLDNITANQVKFRADFPVLHAKAPAGLEKWPDPDAVFIGGSGGELAELLRLCCRRLQADGRIVVNAATLETLNGTREVLQQEGFESRITMVQAARSKPILNLTRLEGFNPVWIICGTRKPTEEREKE